jgi:hypothetical protein
MELQGQFICTTGHVCVILKDYLSDTTYMAHVSDTIGPFKETH